MSEASNDSGSGRDAEQQEIADTQDELDARADGDGLAAEADAAEGAGISQG